MLMLDQQPDLLNPSANRAAIKAIGGAPYAELLARERKARAEYRVRHPRYWAEYENGPRPFKTALCAAARARGRKRGLPATIRPEDLVWPSHCPVLGILLDYPEREGERTGLKPQPSWPSLDRWDSTKGYVPGNVFVISFRANTLKNNARPDEILKIAKYVMSRP
jgi:hypothetical protein